MHIANLPVLAHLVIESMAALSFLLQPQIQLQDSKPSDEAVLICHSYAGSLLATDALCLLFLVYKDNKKFDETSAMLAGSLAIYHLFPVKRAWARIRKRTGDYKQEERMAGGPPVHLAIHGVLFVTLGCAGLYGRQ